MTKTPTLESLSQLARSAGAITLKHFTQLGAFDEKDERKGIVTQADLESEELIRGWIRANHPGDFILAEESGWSGSLPPDAKGVPLWLVDPLDGTTNFSKGNPYYCVSIGYGVCNGGRVEMRAGVIYHPALDTVFSAEKGKGAWKNGVKLAPPSEQDFRLGCYATGVGSADGDMLRTLVEMVYRVQSKCTSTAVRMNGAAALDLAFTANGVFQGFWEQKLNPWDTAAGSLIAREAGFTVTNGAGDSYEVLRDQSIVCAHPKLHAQLLRLIQG